jgi:hypothetical protein
MQTSSFEYLKNTESIVLYAGHGGIDPHSQFKDWKKADQTFELTQLISKKLQDRAITIHTLPTDLDIIQAIQHINNRFSWNQTWAIEIHRDSVPTLDFETASKLCGIYGFGSHNHHEEDHNSMNIARYLKDELIHHGAHPNSWVRRDNQSGPGRLNWIRDIVPVSHVINLGYLEGDSSSEHLEFLSTIASDAIYNAFVGHPHSHQTPGLHVKDTIALLNPFKKHKVDESVRFESFEGEKEAIHTMPDTQKQDKEPEVISKAEVIFDAKTQDFSPTSDTINTVQPNHVLNPELIKKLDEYYDLKLAMENQDWDYILNQTINLRNHAQTLTTQYLQLSQNLTQFNTQIHQRDEKILNLQSYMLSSSENSTVKPFWRSKKTIVLFFAVLLGIAGRFDPRLNEMFRDFLPLIAIYLTGQSAVDFATSFNKPND